MSGTHASDWLGLLFAIPLLLSPRPWLRWTCLLLLATTAGLLYCDFRERPRKPQLNIARGEMAIFEGCVVEPPVFHEDRATALLELGEHARARLSVILKPEEKAPELRYGQRVEVVAKLREPRNYGNPGAFQYTEYLERRQIYWLLGARPSDIKSLDGECGSAWWRAVYGARSGLIDRIERSFQDPSTAALMKTLLIGESAALESKLTDAFRQTASYHALVISGMHLSMLCGLVLAVMALIPVSPMYRLIPALLVAWGYTALNGIPLPLLRAAVALSLLLPSRYLYRRQRPANTLAATLLLFVMWDPQCLWEGSFHLTFTAVAALFLLVVPVLEQRVAPWQKGLWGLQEEDRDLLVAPAVSSVRLELRLLVQTLRAYVVVKEGWLLRGASWALRFGLAVSAACITTALVQSAMLPWQLTYFHQFPLTGLAANLTVVPLLCLLVPVGLLQTVVSWGWLEGVCQLGAALAANGVSWMASWEPMPRLPDIPLVILLAFGVGMGGVALLIKQRRSGVALLLAGVVVFAALGVAMRSESKPGVLELSLLDVGQGEALLVRLPGGSNVLVDGGGIAAMGGRKSTFDMGEQVVSPYLWHERLRRVDVLINTHQHDDHLDGLHAALRNFGPREIWTGALVKTEGWLRLEEQAVRRGVKIRKLRKGWEQTVEGVKLRVLWPEAEYVAGSKPINDDSLVLLLEYGKHRFLLTGDAEARAEEGVLEVGHVDVLKAGHHGSRTSSTEALLEATKPTFALMSLGFENMYRFPHPQVMERMRKHHVEVLRTDRDGLIRVRSDGKRLEVTSTLP